MSIIKIQHQSDVVRINEECDKLINEHGWNYTNQICLTHKENSQNIWFDAAGSLYNKKDKIFIGQESDYSLWNIDETWYIRNQIEKLKSLENCKTGRIRLMRLLPKTGLSVHSDSEIRYHLVIKTNQYSYIAFNTFNKVATTELTFSAMCYHIPSDGWWYKVDTRKIHWVYNGGETERIHLVLCSV